MSTTPPFNPFDAVSPADLYDQELVLHLLCGRNKGTTRDKHRKHACDLAQILAAEAHHRGAQSPQPPYKA